MSEMIWWSSIIVVPMILPLYRCMQGLKTISYFKYSKVPIQVILENAVLLVLFVEKVANARWSWRCFRRPSYRVLVAIFGVSLRPMFSNLRVCQKSKL